MPNLEATFWGVRGSVPSPITTAEILKKVKAGRSLDSKDPDFEKRLERIARTYGGNTSCVEVVVGAQRLVFDLGTGARSLGVACMQEMFKKKGLVITFLLSHVHWDHIQGLPFFAPLYINKATGIKNK